MSSGSCRVSASMKSSNSPLATRYPWISAHCFPNQAAGSAAPRTRRTLPRVSGACTRRSTISPVPSVEPSSTTTISTGSYVVPRTDRTHVAMFAASLRAGMIAETSGPLAWGG